MTGKLIMIYEEVSPSGESVRATQVVDPRHLDECVVPGHMLAVAYADLKRTVRLTTQLGHGPSAGPDRSHLRVVE